MPSESARESTAANLTASGTESGLGLILSDSIKQLAEQSTDYTNKQGSKHVALAASNCSPSGLSAHGSIRLEQSPWGTVHNRGPGCHPSGVPHSRSQVPSSHHAPQFLSLCISNTSSGGLIWYQFLTESEFKILLYIP